MDSRTVKSVLKELAESPRPVAEVCFNDEGDITKIVFESSASAPKKTEPEERDQAPKIKPKKKTAIHSLSEAPPVWVPDVAPEYANG